MRQLDVARPVIDLDSSIHDHPQQPLFSDYRYFPILTSRTDDLESVEAGHPDHAQIDMDQISELEAAADRSVVDHAACLPV